MKRLLIPLALALSLQHVSAALPLFFDPFADATANSGTSYTAGSALAGQQNNSANIWNSVNSNAGGPQPLINAGSLSYPNMPQSSGNSVSFVPATTVNQGVRLNFNATIPTNAAYFSYILKITDISKVSTSPTTNFFGGWSDGSAAQPGSPVLRVGTKILTKATGTGGFVLGVGRNNVVADYVYDTNVYTTNDVLFIVGSYEYLGTVTNVNLWINPPTNSFGSNAPPAPTVSSVHFSTPTGDINTSRVQGFVILCQNSNAPSGLIDELRIGTNWSSVTGGDPCILTQPVSQTKPAGNNVTFSIAARGTSTLSYQWVKNGTTILSDGGNISGSGSPTLTVNNISAGDVGAYSVFVTNGLGSFAQSSSANLVLLTDPIISIQPQGLTTNFGATATLQVTATGTLPIHYQWHKEGGDLSDGGIISGSHSNILTLTGVAFSDGGNYSVTVSNSQGVLDSSAAVLTVLDPYITTQPVSASAGAGGTATFHLAATGTGGAGSFTYQWFKNGSFIFDNANRTGTASDTMTISNITANDQASYYATIIGTQNNTVTSSVVTLTVLSGVSIVSQPNPRTVAPGVRAVFVVGAAGSGPIGYQWQLGGVNISNANSATYVVSNAQATVAGNYQVIVTNSFSSVTSSVAALTVSTNLTLGLNNLMVIRVGDGAQTLSLNGNSMYLDQYATDGTYINTVTIPESGPSAMIAIGVDNATGVNAGSTTGSCLTRSLDGRFMVIAGYNTNLSYNANLSTSFSTNVPRGIGLIESHAQYSMPVANTNSSFDQTFWRAGITDGTNNFWGAGGISGTYYFGFGAPPATVQNTLANLRSMALINGDIYCASAAGTNPGVLKISGMPETLTSGTPLIAGSTGTFDMDVSPNGNLIYVADQRGIGTSGGGVLRYDFDGTNWNLSYTLQVGGQGAGSHGPRYVTADFSGANPIVYVTSNDGTFDNNRIIKIVDTGSTSTGTAIANAGINQTFRGIRFGPVVNTVVARPTLSFSNAGSNLVLSWTGSFTLQSATNATGPYSDVSGATSPYTNNIGAAPQKFFRLRQ